MKTTKKSKVFYKSKTLQALFPLVVLLFSKIFNVQLSTEEEQLLLELLAIITTIIGVFAGRIRTDKKLTIKE